MNDDGMAPGDAVSSHAREYHLVLVLRSRPPPGKASE